MKKTFSGIVMAGLMLIGAGCTLPAQAPTSTQQQADATNAEPSAPRSATRLDLSGSGLKRVPSDVFGMTELRELDVSDNDLTGALQAEIRQLKNLQVLDASANEMTGIPAEIGQLSALRDLDLSENKLTGLPLELGNISNLRRLDLRGNNISKQDLDAIRAKLKATEILE